MLYDQAKRDIFSSFPTSHQHHQHQHHHQHHHHHHHDQLKLVDEDGTTPVHAPSVTTIVLLQVQASMIQVISKLKVQKKGIQQVVQIPIRWGLLFGLLVVDNVARALQVDQEMACLQHADDRHHSDEQTVCDNGTMTEEDEGDDNLSLTSADDFNHHHQPLPQRSQSATTHNQSYFNNQHYHHSSTFQPRPTVSFSSSPPSSPLLAIPPPLVSQSSEGLRVRVRKVSSPPALTNGRPSLTQRSQDRQSPVGHLRSLSNNIHDGARLLPKSSSTTTSSSPSSNKPLPTVRRITAQRDLAVATSSTPTTTNGLRRQTSLHNLNVEKPVKRSQRQHRPAAAATASTVKAGGGVERK